MKDTVHSKRNFSCSILRFASVLLLSVLVLTGLPARGQSTPPAAGAVAGANLQPPIPGAGHSYVHLLSETVNPATGNLTVRIQLPVPTGRGVTPPVAISYNSGSVWSLIEPYGSLLWATSSQNPAGAATGWGTYADRALSATASQWNYTAPILPGQTQPQQNCNFDSGFQFTDLNGAAHTLAIGAMAPADNNQYGPNCGTNLANTGDSDGQTWSELPSNAATLLSNGDPMGVSAIDRFGNTYDVGTPGMNSSIGGVVTMEDRNGNVITPGSWKQVGSVWESTGTDTASRAMPLFLPDQAGTYDVYGLDYIVTTTTTTVNYKPGQTLSGIESGASNCDVTAQFSTNSATITVISSITLPNGQKYQFHYDPTYGLIDEIDFPGGGWVKYTWGVDSGYSSTASFPAVNNSTGQQMSLACTLQYQTPTVLTRTVSFNGSTAAQTQNFSYVTNWGSNGAWTTKDTQIETTDNVMGKQFATDYTYSPTSNDVASPYATASFSLLPMEETVKHFDWNNSSTPIDTVTEAWYNQFQKACEVHTLNNGESYGNFYTWTDGFISDDKEYDYGAVSNLAGYCTPTNPTAPPATPTKETVTAFRQFTSPAPPHLNFYKPSSVISYENRTKVSETDYGYDQYSLAQVSGITSHDETNFPYTTVVNRGNVTTVTHVCLSGTGCSGNSVTTYLYDEAGQVVSAIDPCGNGSCGDMSGSNHTTNYYYTDNYSSGTPPGTTDAYVTKVVAPQTSATHTTTYAYSYLMGDLTSSTDVENSATTTYQYGIQPSGCSYQDDFDRLGQVTSPDGGITTYCYDDASSILTTSTLISSSSNLWKTVVAQADGMGHVIQTTVDDPQGTDTTETTYDGEGRVFTQTNPHRSSSASTDGTTTRYYDAVGRSIAQKQPDGSWLNWCYNGVVSTLPSGASDVCQSHLGHAAAGTWVDTEDETGRRWQRTSDSLGRLTEVMEPDSSDNDTIETDYNYPPLGFEVDQWAGRTVRAENECALQAMTASAI